MIGRLILTYPEASRRVGGLLVLAVIVAALYALGISSAWIGHALPSSVDWLKENPEARFCLLNLDVDIYEPTRVILEECWDRLVPGGVLVLDEYATSKWPGETLAWDEFARSRKIDKPLSRFPWANAPGAWLVK